MKDPRDKTLEWTERTQQLRRTPPLRGGVPTDYRTRQHTAVSIGVILLVLLGLYSLPPPSPAEPPGRSGQVTKADSGPAAGAVPFGGRSTPLLAGVPHTAAEDRRPDEVDGARWDYAPPPSLWVAPAAGSVPPPAPTWLDGPEWARPPWLR